MCSHRSNTSRLVFMFGVTVALISGARAQDEDFATLCKTGDVRQMELAIKAGADVNAKGDNGETPLMVAALRNPNPEVIAALVKAGADVNAKMTNGMTPLMIAASKNPKPEVTTALAKAGADVNAKDKNGTTPLMGAAFSNPNPDVIAALLKTGGDENGDVCAGKSRRGVMNESFMR